MSAAVGSIGSIRALGRSIGLTARLHRFETVAFALLTVLGVAATFIVAARIDAVGYGAQCVAGLRDGTVPAGCEFKANEFYRLVSSEGGIVSAVLTAVPLLAGLLLGVAVVGREIERGTTRLAWALTPSRMRWLAQRAVPVLGGVFVVGLILGVAADRLLRSTEPGVDPANALLQFGQRGPVAAARAFFVLSVAITVGAIVGRALPALLLSLVIAIVGLTGGSAVHDRIIRGEAVVLEAPMPGDLQLDQRFRLPDGRLIGWDEVERYEPPPLDPTSVEAWPTLPAVMLGIPGTRYAEISLREIGALLGGSAVALLLTAFVVQRRRPS